MEPRPPAARYASTQVAYRSGGKDADFEPCCTPCAALTANGANHRHRFGRAARDRRVVGQSCLALAAQRLTHEAQRGTVARGEVIEGDADQVEVGPHVARSE